MGIESNGAAFLISARKSGVSFSRSITIGRQTVKFGLGSLGSMLRQAGFTIPQEDQDRIFSGDGYAEPFLRLLGADEAESFDNSDYEHATHIGDLNQPIESSLKGRYTAVIDGGSTEHVFNYPQAIKNCMELLQVGGHYLGIVPANNLCGHGFYQFSPELMFRVFAPENGFQVERVYIAEQIPGAKWMRMPDPAEVARRIEYGGRRPAYLYVRARKVAEAKIFGTIPQQSDYVSYWAVGAGDHKRRKGVSRIKNLIGGLPSPFKRTIVAATSVIKRRRDPAIKPVDIFID
ncbi:hypothetical protein NKL05_13985 [Mesorhizobium sp. C420B]|uniref:hypothetical protein n=1 Tax=unclassified Mesorhizobium TaxID=325217 RepID=UPI0012EB1C32|nr:hypothetical protein [Mesorhizobium sp. LSHC420B00]